MNIDYPSLGHRNRLLGVITTSTVGHETRVLDEVNLVPAVACRSLPCRLSAAVEI